ncbi:hypothetical protein PYCC9005_002916 [Savitreella phatthalungensis]
MSVSSAFLLVLASLLPMGLPANVGSTSYNEGEFSCNGYTFTGERVLTYGWGWEIKHHHWAQFPHNSGDRLFVKNIEDDDGDFYYGIPFDGYMGDDIHLYYSEAKYHRWGTSDWDSCS